MDWNLWPESQIRAQKILMRDGYVSIFCLGFVPRIHYLLEAPCFSKTVCCVLDGIICDFANIFCWALHEINMPVFCNIFCWVLDEINNAVFQCLLLSSGWSNVQFFQNHLLTFACTGPPFSVCVLFWSSLLIWSPISTRLAFSGPNSVTLPPLFFIWKNISPEPYSFPTSSVQQLYLLTAKM